MKNSTALILILIAIGLFYIFINPQYGEVKSLSTLAGTYENVLQNTADIARTRDELLFKYQEIPSEEVERLAKVLPDHVDTVRLALDLDGMAAKYGISIEDIRVSGTGADAAAIIAPNSGLAYGKAMVSFSFVSDYPDFRDFLADLEKSLRLSEIKSVSFRVGQTNFHDHEVTIETYWLK